MTSPRQTDARRLLESEKFRKAKSDLLAAIQEAGLDSRKVRASQAELKEEYQKALAEFQKDRGRELYYPFLGSGFGSGPYIELADGSRKLDLITGIGIHFFGHAHPALMAEMIDAIPSALMQGNLQPGLEARECIAAVLKKVGPGSRLRHGWLMCSGTMVNEVALKIIRQKKQPATKIMAFEDCFAGRSTAMQEITDNPGYRQGQPIYGEVHYLPFYSPSKGLAASLEATLGQLKQHTTRYPGRFAALMLELIQGEGGFNSAPKEWYVRVFEEAKKQGMAIWADEIQTFGRTGELFAYQTLDLAEHIDVVTIGKMLQACMVLYTEEYNPKPGLVAGTFAGSSVALRAARRTVELLTEGGFLGKEGRINQLSGRFVSGLEKLKAGSCKGRLGEIRAVGGMIAFAPFGGTLDEVKATLMKLYELGAVAFYCGHGPYLVRMLPPLGVMTDQDVDDAVSLIEKAILGVSETRKP